MKITALVATSLALLGAGAIAQDAHPSAKTVRVTNGSVVTLYSIPARELNSAESYMVEASGGVTVNNRSGEIQAVGGVTIRVGQSLDIFADKTTMNVKDGHTFILLQSDGKIESGDSEHKVTQFAAEGTRIELP